MGRVSCKLMVMMCVVASTSSTSELDRGSPVKGLAATKLLDMECSVLFRDVMSIHMMRLNIPAHV